MMMNLPEKALEVIYNKIETWDFNDPIGLFEYMKDFWAWPDYIQIKRKYVYIHTGGWSDHEIMIRALKDNVMINSLYWKSSERGGHYIYDISGYRIRKNKEKSK